MKHIITLILLSGLILSCDKQQNEPENENIFENIALEGVWHLIDVRCYCAPVDFEKGDHVWSFDLEESMVAIENVADEPLQILDNGTYDIVVDGGQITIDGITYDFSIENDELYLLNTGRFFVSDLPELDFVRD